MSVHVRDRVTVVTGGASGIGRALCWAFAARGASSVVVADIDDDGAHAVASGIEANGGSALAVHTDVARQDDVEALVKRSEDAFGPIDLFCANAGIVVRGGVEVADNAWERLWLVNVMSHVYAARAVLPGMLERGGGYLLHTASAAGLLTQLGSAPYAVTKHAIVALAEWISVTYGHAGIKVSCLCPQGVWTKMTADNRTAARGADASSIARDGMLEPEQVAETVIAGLESERFLILPHPEVATYERQRAEDRDRWLRGMRRLQATLKART